MGEKKIAGRGSSAKYHLRSGSGDRVRCLSSRDTSRLVRTQAIHRGLESAAVGRVATDAASGRFVPELEEFGNRRPGFRSLREEPSGIMDLLIVPDKGREVIAQLLLDRLPIFQRGRWVLGDSTSGCSDGLGVFHPEPRGYSGHVPLEILHDVRQRQLIRLGLCLHLRGIHRERSGLLGHLLST